MSRYFYTNITPVLLKEILADTQLDRNDMDRCRTLVANLARKVIPTDAITNLDYRTLCIADLMGGKIKMDRRPIVGGGQSVTTTEGRTGAFVGVQPENEAVLRWRHGEFSERDLEFGMKWRKAIGDANLEVEKRKLPKLSVPIKNLLQLKEFVDTLLNDADSQAALLERLMELLRLEAYIREWARSRWRNGGFGHIRDFAPYACHCLRVQLLFLFGMSSGQLGTKNSNIVDVEYLYYVPFCQIFSSGDKFLGRLASLVLGDDQSFVGLADLRQALDDVAARRDVAQTADERATIGPDENSLIQALWKRHWGRSVPKPGENSISKERREKILEELKPIIAAMQKAKETEPKDRRFPV